jgi:hypothetical protein
VYGHHLLARGAGGLQGLHRHPLELAALHVQSTSVVNRGGSTAITSCCIHFTVSTPRRAVKSANARKPRNSATVN